MNQALQRIKNKKEKLRLSALETCFLFVLSWGMTAFGQPAWIPFLCPFAALCGFALFWKFLQKIESIPNASEKLALVQKPFFRRVGYNRFLWSLFWFFCVQLIQLSWLTSHEYQGYYIFGVYGALCLLLGAQFAVLTLFVFLKKGFDFKHIVASAALWTLLEWVRLFFLCGFSWNPVGLSLTEPLYPLQFANLGGIYGLSFWVILINVFLYKLLEEAPSWTKISWKKASLWVGLASLPFVYGYLVLGLMQPERENAPRISVGLIQTSLLPSQKIPLPGKQGDFIRPLDQWKRILSYLSEKKETWNLLVFPEAVVPMQFDFCCYSYVQALGILQTAYEADLLIKNLPPLKFPFAEYRFLKEQRVLCVSNAFFAQTIANMHHAQVVIGLDHRDEINAVNYNSAFYLTPHSEVIKRYDKQILLPLAEYLPFSFLKSLTSRYGIFEFFSHGKQAMVVNDDLPLGLSICYEETFPEVIRKSRLLGAEMFVNVTNDNYYPFSKLPEQHFSLARVRAVENGVPLLRACNTGVTSAVNPFGKEISRLGKDAKEFQEFQGVLSVSLAHSSHKTPYMLWGDLGIVGVCLISLFIFIRGGSCERRFQLEENRGLS